MPRYKLTIEYDGTPFVGWQRQANGRSVQAAIEDAIDAFCGDRQSILAAGRTDAGVHALGQVAHADLVRDWPEDTVRDALNACLRPAPVAVLSAERMPDGFNARFSASQRHYLYRIINRRPQLALDRERAWWYAKPLDADAMREAAGRLLGHHDFTTFRASRCQAKSPMKTLERLDVTRCGDVIEIRTSSRSFLHNQVRSMVGSLALVGEGKWTADDISAALAARDRKACGPVAPACGLYLDRVDYY